MTNFILFSLAQSTAITSVSKPVYSRSQCTRFYIILRSDLPMHMSTSSAGVSQRRRTQRPSLSPVAVVLPSILCREGFTKRERDGKNPCPVSSVHLVACHVIYRGTFLQPFTYSPRKNVKLSDSGVRFHEISNAPRGFTECSKCMECI